MARKTTKLYDEWIRSTDYTLGPKELKFGLAAFDAGYKAASKLNESYGVHEPGPENKKIALVRVSNGEEIMKIVVGYDESNEENMFDSFEDIVNHSILYGIFGHGNGGFQIESIEEMSIPDFETIVGEFTADRAYNCMEERDYYYTIVSKGSNAALAKAVQAQDEADSDLDSEFI